VKIPGTSPSYASKIPTLSKRSQKAISKADLLFRLWDSGSFFEMSRLYDVLSQNEKAKVRVLHSTADSQPDEGGRHRSDLGGSALEEIVKFVQRVFVFPNSHSPRLVVFSGVENKGSSEICYRAGEVLAAHVSGSVCLVDADLRAPSLHQQIGVGKCPGLAEAVVSPGPIKNFAVRIAGGNLWVIPPGSFGAEAQTLFASDGLRSRMVDLKEEFDYVLIDSSPVSSNADAVLLGQMADGIILVVQADFTRREAARIAKETIDNVKVRLLGAILTDRKFPIPEALYRKL
jgi:Mrp family chromosome partitioning ATPase